MTELDRAHAAMIAGDDAAALRFYQVLADTPLLVLLDSAADGDRIVPRLFDLPEGPVLLAFDSEERLAMSGLGQGGLGQGGGQGGAPLPYAELPGRSLARHLQGTSLSLGLNLGTGAASETLLPPEALVWLVAMLDAAPETLLARPARFLPPQDLPQPLLAAVEQALAGAAGLVPAALLAEAVQGDGRRGPILALIDVPPGAEAALAQAMAEAAAFSGLGAGALDVTFLRSADPAAARLARVARAVHIARPPPPPPPSTPAAPGMDKDRPPILR